MNQVKGNSIPAESGGPDGELSASMRYLAQRYSMPYSEVSGLLTDIGTEELAHGCWKSYIISSTSSATGDLPCLV